MNTTYIEVSLDTESQDPTVDELLEFIELATSTGASGTAYVSVLTERLTIGWSP